MSAIIADATCSADPRSAGGRHDPHHLGLTVMLRVGVRIPAVGFYLAARYMRANTPDPAEAGRLDLLGLALLAPSVAAIVLELKQRRRRGDFAPPDRSSARWPISVRRWSPRSCATPRRPGRFVDVRLLAPWVGVATGRRGAILLASLCAVPYCCPCALPGVRRLGLTAGVMPSREGRRRAVAAAGLSWTADRQGMALSSPMTGSPSSPCDYCRSRWWPSAASVAVRAVARHPASSSQCE